MYAISKKPCSPLQGSFFKWEKIPSLQVTVLKIYSSQNERERESDNKKAADHDSQPLLFRYQSKIVTANPPSKK